MVNRTPSESLPIPASADVTKNGIIIVLPPGEYTNVKIDYALVTKLPMVADIIGRYIRS